MGEHHRVMATRQSRSVLIVDDHSEFRSVARLLLDTDGWNVVGEAADAAQALDAAAALRPDVVLLDIQLPDRSGFEVAAELARAVQAPCVVLMSSRDASDYGARLRDGPALAFVAKRDLSSDALMALFGPDLATGHPDRR